MPGPLIQCIFQSEDAMRRTPVSHRPWVGSREASWGQLRHIQPAGSHVFRRPQVWGLLLGRVTSASIHSARLSGPHLHCTSFLFKGLKNQSRVKLNIVRCPPVTTVLIRRPDLRYQLGFSVQNGIVSTSPTTPFSKTQ